MLVSFIFGLISDGRWVDGRFVLFAIDDPIPDERMVLRESPATDGAVIGISGRMRDGHIVTVVAWGDRASTVEPPQREA